MQGGPQMSEDTDQAFLVRLASSPYATMQHRLDAVKHITDLSVLLLLSEKIEINAEVRTTAYERRRELIAEQSRAKT